MASSSSQNHVDEKCVPQLLEEDFEAAARRIAAMNVNQQAKKEEEPGMNQDIESVKESSLFVNSMLSSTSKFHANHYNDQQLNTNYF